MGSGQSASQTAFNTDFDNRTVTNADVAFLTSVYPNLHPSWYLQPDVSKPTCKDYVFGLPSDSTRVPGGLPGLGAVYRLQANKMSFITQAQMDAYVNGCYSVNPTAYYVLGGSAVVLLLSIYALS